MNFEELVKAIKHLVEKSNCPHCQQKNKYSDIYIVACTRFEAMVEIQCETCNSRTIASVFSSPSEKNLHKKEIIDRKHRKISQNDVLDMKNFLNNFDGDFKDIFRKKN